VSYKIAIVSPRFPSNNAVGGAETLLKNFASSLIKMGCEVSFFTTCATNHFTWRNEITPGEQLIEGIKVKFFSVDADRNVSRFLELQGAISANRELSHEEAFEWLKNSVNSSSLMEALIKENKEFDCIITGPYLFGLTYFAATTFPDKTFLVPCLHDEGFARVSLIAQMFKKVKAILFNTVPEKQFAIKLYGIDEKKAFVVGMGIDPFEASPEPFLKKYQIKSKYVIYSGRRESAKGVPLLCHYLALFRHRTNQDIRLVITGSGPVEAPDELLPYIVDTGYLSETEKHQAMSGAIAFCHPSILESFGIVLLEAWMAGTPALVHGKCEVTRFHCEQSGGGLWFSVYPEFEESLMFLLENENIRKAMGRAGKNYVALNYNQKIITEKLITAIQEALL
jgi:glycosyltransferase involved in cell wall biosynthesis